MGHWQRVAKILMAASEAAPFAKTGGLSDVTGSLPKALAALGHEIMVLLPRYAVTRPFPMRRIWDDLPVPVGPKFYHPAVYQSDDDPAYLFLDVPELYNRDGLYGDAKGEFPDNDIRFAVLARGAAEVVRRIFAADVVHCHDWQAALAPLYLRQIPYDPTFTGTRTLLTIHNLGYQGIFPRATLDRVGIDPGAFTPDGVEFWGQVNYLKAGLVYSGLLNTVSRKYAQEIQTPEFGFGLDGVLRARGGALSGILNGVDYTVWNPAADPMIPAPYSVDDLAGKAECKRALLAEFGFPPAEMATPLLGIVSRFTSMKGADLIADAAPGIFGTEAVNLIALGNGETQYEELFRSLGEKFPNRVAVHLGFDEAMAHRIEAGADMFLMPSRYEPCGLNQIYSLRYGTVPVVRATGGLDDTIDSGTGFKFAGYSGEALAAALREALAAYGDRKGWTRMMLNGMSKDYSWGASAREYSRLYERLLNPGADKNI